MKKKKGGGGKRVQGWTETSGNRRNFLVRRVNRMNIQYQALWTSRINLTEVIKSRESISPTNCSLSSPFLHYEQSKGNIFYIISHIACRVYLCYYLRFFNHKKGCANFEDSFASSSKLSIYRNLIRVLYIKLETLPDEKCGVWRPALIF